MPNATYQAGQHPACPRCGKVQEAAVEDYVVPGRVGAASAAEDECGWCDSAFRVELTPQGTYTLTDVGGND